MVSSVNAKFMAVEKEKKRQRTLAKQQAVLDAQVKEQVIIPEVLEVIENVEPKKEQISESKEPKKKSKSSKKSKSNKKVFSNS